MLNFLRPISPILFLILYVFIIGYAMDYFSKNVRDISLNHLILIFIIIPLVGIVALIFFLKKDREANINLTKRFVTMSDFPDLITTINDTGKNGSFWSVQIPGTALSDGCLADLQCSIEDSSIGLDWVLLGERNIREKNNFVQIINESGFRAEPREQNDVPYLRVVGAKDISTLGQVVLKRLFAISASEELSLVTTGFKWKKPSSIKR